MANLTIVDVPEHMSYVSTWLVLSILNIPRTRGMLGSSVRFLYVLIVMQSV